MILPLNTPFLFGVYPNWRSFRPKWALMGQLVCVIIIVLFYPLACTTIAADKGKNQMTQYQKNAWPFTRPCNDVTHLYWHRFDDFTSPCLYLRQDPFAFTPGSSRLFDHSIAFIFCVTRLQIPSAGGASHLHLVRAFGHATKKAVGWLFLKYFIVGSLPVAHLKVDSGLFNYRIQKTIQMNGFLSLVYSH